MRRISVSIIKEKKVRKFFNLIRTFVINVRA